MRAFRHSGRRDRFAFLPELGLEPAIAADGARRVVIDRRRVSLRWLTGTILTGCVGATLIGGAIYAALDRQSNFAEAPSPAVGPRREATAELGINPRKGDRLMKAVDIVAAKQEFKAPTTIKLGDKEVVRSHTFARVETTLLLSSAGFADEVPAFNPLKLLADARNPIDVAPEPVQDDAEVSWTTRDFAPQSAAAAVALSLEEVQAQVTEHIKNTVAAGAKPIALPPQLLLMRTSRAGTVGALAYADSSDPLRRNPFSSIEVRMVPENVSSIPEAPQTSQMEEKLIIVRHGEAFDDELKAAGVDGAAIPAIIAAFAAPRGQPVVAEGRRVRLLFADLDGSGKTTVLARLSVYAEQTLETTIAVTDHGSYVKVAAAETPAARARAASDDDEDEGAMRLYDSLFETALKQDIPRPIIEDLVRVFANDVDFQRSVTGGDSFTAFYDESEEGEGHNELLYASITARNETFRYYRFQTPDDGIVDYYDPSGRSSRKFLVRMPLLSAKMTSGFGVRFHPILGYSRPHTGVDWAAPIGTPIFAAGNGTIIKAGWDSGYGRRIEIQHANGYITTYNHLSGFARGTVEGAKVRQGQVIAYLGQTGLATGPHLHYEVMVNGHFVDPMRVKLARTREFDGPMLAAYKRERDRIDGLLAMAPTAQRLVAAKDK